MTDDSTTPSQEESMTQQTPRSTPRQAAGGEPEKKSAIAVYLVLVAFLLVIVGIIIFALSQPKPETDMAPTPSASETAAAEEAQPEPTESNEQGIDAVTAKEMGVLAADGDGLIDYIQFDPATSSYEVIVRNVSDVKETYSVTVLLDGEVMGAKGVEVEPVSTSTVVVETTVPPRTQEVTVRLDGKLLGEGVAEVAHPN